MEHYEAACETDQNRYFSGNRGDGPTLKAVVGCYLVHHLLVAAIPETVAPVRVEEMMGCTIASKGVQFDLE